MKENPNKNALSALKLGSPLSWKIQSFSRCFPLPANLSTSKKRKNAKSKVMKSNKKPLNISTWSKSSCSSRSWRRMASQSQLMMNNSEVLCMEMNRNRNLLANYEKWRQPTYGLESNHIFAPLNNFLFLHTFFRRLPIQSISLNFFSSHTLLSFE